MDIRPLNLALDSSGCVFEVDGRHYRYLSDDEFEVRWPSLRADDEHAVEFLVPGDDRIAVIRAWDRPGGGTKAVWLSINGATVSAAHVTTDADSASGSAYARAVLETALRDWQAEADRVHPVA